MTESISPFAIPPVPDRYRDGDNRLIKALATEQIMDAAVASHALRALARAVMELREEMRKLPYG